MIRPPFADYHRAELERLVHEGFERIEAAAAIIQAQSGWTPLDSAINLHEFQVLVAAEYYLRKTSAAETGQRQKDLQRFHHRDRT